MSLRKPLPALAAVTAALALAVPAASASASTTEPALPTASIGRFELGAFQCRILVGELRFAELTRSTPWVNYIARVLQYSGCGGAAI